MGRYAFIFSAVHLPFTLIMSWLFVLAGTGSGGVAGIVGIYAASLIAGSSFARTKRRLYTGSEQKDLRNGCLVYLFRQQRVVIRRIERGGDDVLSSGATNVRAVRKPSIVRQIWWLLACAFGLSSLASGSEPADIWQPSPGHLQVPIWPGAVPDATPNPKPESVGPPEGREWWPRANDVSQPTMTVYAAEGRSTGAAVVVFPGGGFKFLAMDLEGTEICDWLTSRGITCVLSKYRVPDSNHYWDESCACSITPKVPRALQDAQRTIKLVRARAKDLNVDPNKIGVIGFSAGGYLVAQTSNTFKPAYKPVDAVDELSSRPDFAVALYPGHLCRSGGTLDPGIHVTKQTPPTFLLQAWDDPVDDICNSTVYARALDRAGVPAEVHLFAKGGHAFGLRGKEHPVSSWPSLVESWLKEIGILPP